MLDFEERGKTDNPEKILSEQSKEPTTNLTHIWPPVRNQTPGQLSTSALLIEKTTNQLKSEQIKCLEMLVLEERGKPEYPAKNLLEQSIENEQTQPT